MIHNIFEISNILLDAFILIFFLMSMLGKIKWKKIPFYSLIVTVEVILWLNSHLWASNTGTIKQIVTIFLSVITTYICTLAFSVPTRYRVIFTIVFHMIAALGEVGAYGLLGLVYLTKVIPEEYLYIYIITLSKFLIFIATLAIRNIFSYSDEYRNSAFNLLLSVTPIMSVLITLKLPHAYNVPSDSFGDSFIIILMLFVINFFNYILFHNSVDYYTTLRKNHLLQKQMDYQSENYTHIQESYRNTHRMIHEINSTFTTIEGYIQSHEYNKLLQYINTSKEHLTGENTVNKSGNIVIDSLISNYLLIARKEKIEVNYRINIDVAHIKPNDYDLSIILGNLLENAFKAVKTIFESDSMKIKRYVNIEIFTNDSNLVINIENSFVPKTSTSKGPKSLNHGFGIENISNIVLKYDGNFTYGPDRPGHYTSTVMLPYDLTEEDIQSFIDANRHN